MRLLCDLSPLLPEVSQAEFGGQRDSPEHPIPQTGPQAWLWGWEQPAGPGGSSYRKLPSGLGP